MAKYKGVIYRYSILNSKGVEKSYIGQTTDEKKRKQDFKNLNVKYSGSRIENARRKYLPDCFKYEQLEVKQTDKYEELVDWLDERERFYIEKYDSFKHGYNDTIGGGGAQGYRHSDEYKAWQSRQSKLLNQNPDIKKKQKAGMTAYFSSPEAHEKRKNELKKRYQDPKEREKLSIAQKRSYANNPDRAKTRNAKLSATCSTPEGRKRMGDTSRNAWKRPEYREKYSKSKKALWATPEYRAKTSISFQNMNGKRVRQLSLEGVILEEFPSATAAAKKIGGSFSSIARACRGERATYKGYVWRYISDSEKNIESKDN